MAKTEQQIERDFYMLVTASSLGQALQGNVYRADERPENAQTEDLVIKFLSGVDEQQQVGVVIFNIYVNDITNDNGRKVSNKPRIAQLQELLQSFIHSNNYNNGEYKLQTDGTPATQEVESIAQHIVFARIKFYTLNI